MHGWGTETQQMGQRDWGRLVKERNGTQACLILFCFPESNLFFATMHSLKRILQLVQFQLCRPTMVSGCNASILMEQTECTAEFTTKKLHPCQGPTF